MNMDAQMRARLLAAYSLDQNQADGDHALLKILVSYIRPSFLFATNVLTPIHVGRAVAMEESKDGSITTADRDWLLRNCVGDDDFPGNISAVNRRVGFLTGTYWARENYRRLGDPEYFGSFGYRRFLCPDFMPDVQKYDLILPPPKNPYYDSAPSSCQGPSELKPGHVTIGDQLRERHGGAFYDAMIDIMGQCHADEVGSLRRYLDGTQGYFDELYIMRRSLFFDFCAWIFPLLFAFLKRYPAHLETARLDYGVLVSRFLGPEGVMEARATGTETCHEKRDCAFIMERFTGFFLAQKTRDPGVRFHESEVVLPDRLYANTPLRALVMAKMRQNVRSRLA